MSSNVRRTQVRVPLGGRGQVQEAYATARRPVRGAPHGLDRGADQQRGHLSRQDG